VILAVALNPALVVTHHVPGVDWAGVNRPAVIRARAGGKGLNVARTLRVIGVEVQVIRARGRRYGRAGGFALGSWGAGVAHPDRRRDPADLRCGRCFRPSRSISSTSAAAAFLSSTLGSSRPGWGA
jgi:hypothetical protein